MARLLLVAAATCAGLLLAECLLRMFVEQETRRLAIYDRDLGWRGSPHGRGMYIRRQDGIRTEFSYNNLGFRDEDVGPRKAGDLRILMLGDSFLESLELAYDQIFHELVERLLPARIGRPVDVVALGSQGYSTAQQLLAFRRYHDLVQADVVLSLVYSGNDFEDNLRPQFAYLDDQGRLQLPPPRDSRLRAACQSLKRWLYEHSHLVFLIKNQLESRARVRLAPASKSATDQGDPYKRRIMAQLLAQTRREVAAAGADYAVIVLPAREELASGDRRWINAVVAACQAEGIACFDLSSDLTADHYFATDVHFNRAGHALVAERICDVLADRGEPGLLEQFEASPSASPPPGEP